MSYKCKVCGKTTATNLGMRGHVVNSLFRFQDHWQWLKSHGISTTRKVAQGNYQPLMELVEKECKVED
ncbi:MAG: hypothetical protein NT134_04170 [Chloroflexi bacterium]|nr:hypothetical protein [Chloroflexota bacterium]